MTCPICNRSVSEDGAAEVSRAVSGFLTLSQIQSIAQASGSEAPVESYCPTCLVSEMAAAV